ncbi:MAG: hypothetical protein MJZ91_11435 [Bacteroidales bacterium]|nr:hypothetical protein [Bacteroidales bacterium]
MRKLHWLTGLFCILILQSCNLKSSDSKGVVVAECYGKYLYESDLEGVVAPGTEGLDSLNRVNAFVDSWIRREVLLHQAEQNLSKEQLDFSKQIQEYRNSLVIYAYETQLAEQRLDTVVSDDEIAAYYEQHKDNFELRYTMVKAAYVILKSDCKQKEDFRKLMKESDTLMLQRLDIMATYYAASSYLDVDSWIRLDDLLEIIPIDIYNTESFLKKNRFVMFDKDDFTYMVRFEDYLMEETLSPLEIEKENIKSMILMKRKKDLLDDLKSKLYEKAAKDHTFEVYTGSTASIIDSKEEK